MKIQLSSGVIGRCTRAQCFENFPPSLISAKNLKRQRHTHLTVCASRYVYVCARHNHTLMRGYLLQRHIHTCLHAPVFHIQPPLNEVGEGVRARERERRRGTEGGGGEREMCVGHIQTCLRAPVFHIQPPFEEEVEGIRERLSLHRI